MNRFRRWIFNGIAAVSLALFLLVGAMWAFSYCAIDALVLCDTVHSDAIEIAQSRGEMVFGWLEGSLGSSRFWYHSLRAFDVYQIFQTMGPLGNGWAKEYGGFTIVGDWPVDIRNFGLREYAIILPHWFLFVVFVALPAIWLRKWYRQSQKPGACAKCGYDLRATPDRCPECGTATSPIDSIQPSATIRMKIE